MKAIGIIIQSLISLGILCGGIYGYFAMGEPEVAKRPPGRNGPPVVQTLSTATHEEDLRVEVDGVVVPFRQIEIASEVRGRVSSKSSSCRKGRVVQQGELLIEIDPRDYQLDVQRLEEELKQAVAMIRELEIEIQNAENQKGLTEQQLEIDRRQLERNLQLSTTAAASQSELDAARRAELLTRNTLQGIQDSQNLLRQRLIRMVSGKDLVESNIAKAKLALERTKIFSPVDGVIVEESVEQDGYVQAGVPVIVIQDNSRLDVTCKLQMRQMHWLWQAGSDPITKGSEDAKDSQTSQSTVGADLDSFTPTLNNLSAFPRADAKIIFELDGKQYQWEGVVDRFDGAGVDSQTRLVPCRVHVDSPLEVSVVPAKSGEFEPVEQPPALMTGMFVKVQIRVRAPRPLVRIPQKAIQPGDRVWVVRDGALVSYPLERATVENGLVIAYEDPQGLKAGDSLVISPLASPFDGMKVRTTAMDVEEVAP